MSPKSLRSCDTAKKGHCNHPSNRVRAPREVDSLQKKIINNKQVMKRNTELIDPVKTLCFVDMSLHIGAWKQQLTIYLFYFQISLSVFFPDKKPFQLRHNEMQFVMQTLPKRLRKCTNFSSFYDFLYLVSPELLLVKCFSLILQMFFHHTTSTRSMILFIIFSKPFFVRTK